MVILHEELVSIHYMFGEVPREHFIQRPGGVTKERRNDARLKIRPYTCLYLGQLSLRYTNIGVEETTCLVIAELRLWVILLQNGIEFHDVGVLYDDVDEISDVKGSDRETYLVTEFVSRAIEAKNMGAGLPVVILNGRCRVI